MEHAMRERKREALSQSILALWNFVHGPATTLRIGCSLPTSSARMGHIRTLKACAQQHQAYAAEAVISV